MKIPKQFRQVRKMAYTLSPSRLLRVAEEAEAHEGDKFYQFQDEEGNLLFVAAGNIDNDDEK